MIIVVGSSNYSSDNGRMHTFKYNRSQRDESNSPRKNRSSFNVLNSKDEVDKLVKNYKNVFSNLRVHIYIF